MIPRHSLKDRFEARAINDLLSLGRSCSSQASMVGFQGSSFGAALATGALRAGGTESQGSRA
jgi:hypothetical protein